MSVLQCFKKKCAFEPQSSRCLAYLYERSPHPCTHPQDSMWIGAGSFVSAFILALTKCSRLKEHMQGYQRVQCDPPLLGTTLGGELVTDPPIHGFILQNGLGVCVTRSKTAIVLSFLLCACVIMFVCLSVFLLPIGGLH